MSKGIEMAIRSLLSATGFNVDEVKAEVTQRIAQFEHNVATLNARMEAIDKNLKAICEHHGIPYTPPAEVIPPQKVAAE